MKKMLLALPLLLSAIAVQAQEDGQARYTCNIENYAGVDTSALVTPPVQDVWRVQRNILANVPIFFVHTEAPIIAIKYVTHLSPSQGLLIDSVSSSVTLNFEDGSARTVGLTGINLSQLESPLVSYEINASYDITPEDGQSYRFTYTGDNLVQGLLNELSYIDWDILEGVSTNVTPTISCIDHQASEIIALLEQRLNRVEILHPELAIFNLPLNEAIESLPGPQRYSAYRYQAGEMTRHWAIERIRRTGEDTTKLQLILQYIDEQ
ncbi:hypothetical protein [Pelagibaculum spongiae]|uniref:Uncharacterized protein n=1 Tax=Pelagibaculum spongiae TaxID=2080658 RepID=A0A2V1GRS9_9GAMM|nr:hypothetical protein [Pelagibaculum spongiae]PVZ65471.1 hypothetical protein DC094_18505 [Pelagibaculum spongiae]